MIRTITEAEASALTVPGDLPGILSPGILVEMDWTESDGETEETRRVSGVAVANLPNEHGDPRVLWYSTDPHIGLDNRAAMFLRVPVAGNEAHLVGWLGKGERCCPGDGRSCDCNGGAPTADGSRARGVHDEGCRSLGPPLCARCGDTGWIRPAFDRYAWLTPEALSGLPDWIRLALIWGSVVRVAAGMGPLEEALWPWARDDNRNKCGRGYAGGIRPMSQYAAAWWGNLSAEERATFDAEAIRCPVALIDNTPAGRVIRFEVPE